MAFLVVSTTCLTGTAYERKGLCCFSLGGCSSSWLGQHAGRDIRWLCTLSQEVERGEFWCLAHFLLFIQSALQPILTLRVGLPSSDRYSVQHSILINTPRGVSYVNPNPVELIKIRHCRVLVWQRLMQFSGDSFSPRRLFHFLSGHVTSPTCVFSIGVPSSTR